MSCGAVLLLLLMLGAHGAARAASVFYLIPAGTALMTYLTLGEGLDLVQLAGVVVVTTAVVLIGSTRPRAQSTPATPSAVSPADALPASRRVEIDGRDAATGPMT